MDGPGFSDDLIIFSGDTFPLGKIAEADNEYQSATTISNVSWTNRVRIAYHRGSNWGSTWGFNITLTVTNNDSSTIQRLPARTIQEPSKEEREKREKEITRRKKLQNK